MTESQSSCCLCHGGFLLKLALILSLVFTHRHDAAAEENVTRGTALSIVDQPQSLASVSCPSNQTTFTALTELEFVGRYDLLEPDERRELSATFRGIYNALTEQSCDSYFRRITGLSWVNQTNSKETMLFLEDGPVVVNVTEEQGGGRGRDLASPFSSQTASPTMDPNSTSTPGVTITYAVTGTCRECPLTRGGSFDLYDEGFRRDLLESEGIHMRKLNVIQSSTISFSVTVNNTRTNELNLLADEDCQCVEGQEPTSPQAPGVKQCVNEMNLRFQSIREEQDLLQDLEIVDLLQLDEGVEELPMRGQDDPFLISTINVEEGDKDDNDLLDLSQSTSIIDQNRTLSRVDCPSSQTTFTAITELEFVGRYDLLEPDERRELSATFRGVYNALTEQSCDSYFRRITGLSWVNQTNSKETMLFLEDGPTIVDLSRQGKRLRGLFSLSNPSAFAPTVDPNSTSAPGVTITYAVTGTCRECPLTRGGSFDLYDEGFRRDLLESKGIHMRKLSVIQSSTISFSVTINNTRTSGLPGIISDDDCLCEEGQKPTSPQAPGVKECANEMNLKFENIREEQGLLEDLQIVDLVQLDDGLDEL